MATEPIIVEIREKGAQKIRSLVNLLQNLESLKRTGANVDSAMGRVNKRIDTLTGGAKGVATQFRQFKFELLGVLFFGMAVTRFLKGMIRPALEVTGTFEVLTFHLQQFFIPTAEDAVEITEGLGSAMNELPDSIKRIVGWVVIIVAFIFGLLTAFGIWGLGIDSIKRRFPKLIPALKTFGRWLFRLVFGVGLLTSFKKNWSKVMTKLIPLAKTLGKGLGALFARFNPWIRLVLLLWLAFDLLKAGWKKVRTELEKPGKIRSVLRDVFNDWIIVINKVIDALNRIPGVSIPTITPIASAADVLAVSDRIGANTPKTGNAPQLGDSFFNITINTTNGIDEAHLKDELKLFVNEAVNNGTQNISGVI